METIQEVEMLSKFVHKGQLYGEVDYYSFHIIPVMNETTNLYLAQGGCTDDSEFKDVKCIALLHDSLEDTPLTVEDLVLYYFSVEVIDAVVAITKLDGESRKEYLRRCKKNKLALVVKKADTMVNLRNSYLDGNYIRIKKYTEQLAFLFKEEAL